MNHSRCDQLDEFLCGWLSPGEMAEFDAHLAECDACREECMLQRQINKILAEEVAHIEPVPMALESRIDRTIRTARRRRTLVWAGAMTAAAGILLALGLWTTQNNLFPRWDERQRTQPSAIAGDTLVPIVPPVNSESVDWASVGLKPGLKSKPTTACQVTPMDPSSTIVVPMESHSSNVTVVCIYPTIRADRENKTQTP
jgi:anti-sigma factor RsiW